MKNKCMWTIEQTGRVGASDGHNSETAVVIVTYNSAAFIEKCLSSLKGHTVVVVDNLSTDSTRTIVREDFPDVTLISNSYNVGLSKAFNVGWRAVSSSYVLLLNPDIFIDDIDGALVRLSAVMNTIGAAIVAPRLLNVDGTIQQTAREFPTIGAVLSRRTWLGKTRFGRRANSAHLSPSLSDEVATVDWVLGAAMLIDRRVLDELNGFDEKFFLYCEDVDFCTRAWKSGIETVLVPDVTFVHDYQRASRRTWDLRSRATRAHLRSTARLVWRYPRQFVGRPLQAEARKYSGL